MLNILFANPISLIKTNVGPITHPYYTKNEPINTDLLRALIGSRESMKIVARPRYDGLVPVNNGLAQRLILQLCSQFSLCVRITVIFDGQRFFSSDTLL